MFFDAIAGLTVAVQRFFISHSSALLVFVVMTANLEAAVALVLII